MARRPSLNGRADPLRLRNEPFDDDEAECDDRPPVGEPLKIIAAVLLGIAIAMIIFAVTFAVARIVFPPGARASESRPRLTLQSLAPTRDCWPIGREILVARPDFTGTPAWELHEVKAQNIGGPGDRTQSHWRGDDRAIYERPISNSDYLNNPLALDEKAHPLGMCRFHLCPAGDETQTQEATDATHLTSNCVPADQAFNAQVWERCEQRGRDLVLLAKRMNVHCRVFECNVRLFLLEEPADFSKHAWVGTFNAIGRHCVWMPSHVAKVFYVTWGNREWMEAYLFENSAKVAHDDIRSHLITVDAVEFASNLDLWPGASDDEDDLEASEKAPPTLTELEEGK